MKKSQVTLIFAIIFSIVGLANAETTPQRKTIAELNHCYVPAVQILNFMLKSADGENKVNNRVPIVVGESKTPYEIELIARDLSGISWKVHAYVNELNQCAIDGINKVRD